MRPIHEGESAASAGAAPWSSAITTTTEDRVFVRGLPLDEAIGTLSFADVVFLLWTGRQGIVRGAGRLRRMPGRRGRPRRARSVGDHRPDRGFDASRKDAVPRGGHPGVRIAPRCRCHGCHGAARRARPERGSGDMGREDLRPRACGRPASPRYRSPVAQDRPAGGAPPRPRRDCRRGSRGGGGAGDGPPGRPVTPVGRRR